MSAPQPRRARALLHRATASATAAWGVARYVLDHPAPYFAPIAAMIALTANLGERGLHAVRLLQGVVLGIVVRELVLLTVGAGPGSMALGVFLALTAARTVRGPQIVVVQAAVSTILVVAVGDRANGVQRLVDVLIGAGIALLFTQALFPPEPLALLRRAGRAGVNVARRALVRRATRVVREKENSQYLDLLGTSCLTLAHGLSDPDLRRHAADRSLELATRITANTGPAGSDQTFLASSLRMAATDVIAFAGGDLADAIRAVRAGLLDQRVPPSAPPPGRILGWTRWARRAGWARDKTR